LEDASYRWKPQYPGSQMLCNRDGSAFNVILIGRYSTGQLESAVTNFSNIKYPPAYRLSILLDANPSATLTVWIGENHYHKDI
jgi:hypothetical protein